VVVVKYSTAINHYTALNLTKLDCLDTFETIKIATAYIHPQSGEEIESFPADLDLLGDVKIQYHEMPGWNRPVTGAKSYYDLPKACRDYVVSASSLCIT
jgi:adenylosuccinate synthase